MRKNLNTFRIEGYVYDSSKLTIKETGSKSKNPGTTFISGELNIAVDEEGLNVIPVHFIYVTPTYARSGKQNKTFTVLEQIVENPDATWLVSGKENAMKVRIDGSLGLNDFVAADGTMISAKRCEGSFVNLVTSLPEEDGRNTFQADIVITKVNRVEANPEKYIDKDFVTVAGAIFNFRNELLPIEFIVKSDGGMKYFEGLDASGANPVYTKIWGSIKNEVIQIEKTEESAFGEPSVVTYDRTNRQWLITGTAKFPYNFGEEEVMTIDDLKKAAQDREVYLANIKKNNEEYKKEQEKEVATENKAEVKAGGFTF